MAEGADHNAEVVPSGVDGARSDADSVVDGGTLNEAVCCKRSAEIATGASDSVAGGSTGCGTCTATYRTA
jgi:hypothetical protein